MSSTQLLTCDNHCDQRRSKVISLAFSLPEPEPKEPERGELEAEEHLSATVRVTCCGLQGHGRSSNDALTLNVQFTIDTSCRSGFEYRRSILVLF